MWGGLLDKAREAAAAAGERVDTARGGQKLLQNPIAKAAMQAKKTSVDMVDSDAAVLRQAMSTSQGLQEAARQLRAAANAPEVPGVTGKENFLALAESYEERAKVLEQVSSLLSSAPKIGPPKFTASEKDAMMLVQVTGHLQGVQGQMVDGIDQVRNQVVATQAARLSRQGSGTGAAVFGGPAPAGNASAPPLLS